MARLIWLTGPSGSGKDSLLNALREAPPDNLVIAHRYITRPADAGGENHVALSEAEFRRRQAMGLFAISWQAHGLYYGLGEEIDHWLARGLNVLVNGSRLHLPIVEQHYGTQLLPLVLHVSPAVLEMRLRQRGRESEGEIRQRLARASEPLPAHCHPLNNDGALSDTLNGLRQLLEHPP
ncbi:ribonucleoside-triphosphate reductase [Pantoea sp. BL1]|uniref:ribose 1,5-bisphosphokinase n=1 Tax=Erwiniaceae TaxID=1903409 RepID=UPI0005F7CBB5|nr:MULTISPECIES: ribose 1,5-bisphosphokinase [Erwiniaceae]HAU5562467.1 ribose 1,5-bisphosphokinase [Serratia fonticola]KJV31074.1 ribonucleoside-triphosphate reductase [Pantoea sp. SM3]KJV49201.1 ribonucleoside-triphosphate reductase [Pantoea sp. BL1]MBK0091531.1 ribose 1,5-bisphosphokinase [Erwinia sp. S59]MBK0124794.1 ribose 1,5-bisphosphokinase [Pantoea sp. S61]